MAHSKHPDVVRHDAATLSRDDLLALNDLIIKLADSIDLRTDKTPVFRVSVRHRGYLYLTDDEASALRRLFGLSDEDSAGGES